ncbi:hypothetical protein ACSBR1_040051 [Camellia fascicularis]
MSKDFMQLDLGQLQVRNEFSWHGCPEKDPSAVHLDVLDAEILGINMAVGINGCIGKPMIRDGQGINVYVWRSLRDVFQKVPTFSLGVKVFSVMGDLRPYFRCIIREGTGKEVTPIAAVSNYPKGGTKKRERMIFYYNFAALNNPLVVGLLHAVMSDKEYNVILDCFYMNLSEQPKLPPSFRGSKSGSKETMRLLADKVNINSQILLSHTVTIIAVEVDHALLELCSGVHEDSPLAHVALEGLWVSYQMTSLSGADLYVTIPRFYVLDIRPDTKPEMWLMLGSCTDVPKQASTGKFPFSLNKGGFMRMDSQAAPCIDVLTSTMFLMDYRWRLSSQSFVVQIQQPRVLVVPDFLLAVGEYFVPSLGAITGREELMDPKNDPTRRNNSILWDARRDSIVQADWSDEVLSFSDPYMLWYRRHTRLLVGNPSHLSESGYQGVGPSLEALAVAEIRDLLYEAIQHAHRGDRLHFGYYGVHSAAAAPDTSVSSTSAPTTSGPWTLVTPPHTTPYISPDSLHVHPIQHTDIPDVADPDWTPP